MSAAALLEEMREGGRGPQALKQVIECVCTHVAAVAPV